MLRIMISALFAASLALLAQGLPAEQEFAAHYGERWTPEARVYQLAGPAVVSIDISGDILRRVGFGQVQRRHGLIGQGTGVVIDASGLVITNSHVAVPDEPGVDPKSITIQVSFAERFGGRSYAATVLSIDRQWDLALLKIEGKGPFHTIPLGRSDDLLPGERVVTIGTPYGNQHSVTSGILSGMARDIEVTPPGGGKPVQISGLLQTDAPINPGNSGGPLLNVYGQLIGINSATMLAADGIGFAIPVDRVREILDSRLLDVGHSQRFWAGMTVVDGGGEALPKVTCVHPRGPARAAQIEVGDRIVSVDGQPVHAVGDYATLLLPHRAGDTVRLGLRSPDGKKRTVQLRLLPPEDRDTIGLLGFDARREWINYRSDGWIQRLPVLRITKVYPGTGAADLGLKPGDVVVAVRVKEGSGRESDWVPVRTLDSLAALVRSPDFALDGENLWVLRRDESFRGHLAFDDPEICCRESNM